MQMIDPHHVSNPLLVWLSGERPNEPNLSGRASHAARRRIALGGTSEARISRAKAEARPDQVPPAY